MFYSLKSFFFSYYCFVSIFDLLTSARPLWANIADAVVEITNPDFLSTYCTHFSNFINFFFELQRCKGLNASTECRLLSCLLGHCRTPIVWIGCLNSTQPLKTLTKAAAATSESTTTISFGFVLSMKEKDFVFADLVSRRARLVIDWRKGEERHGAWGKILQGFSLWREDLVVSLQLKSKTWNLRS